MAESKIFSPQLLRQIRFAGSVYSGKMDPSEFIQLKKGCGGKKMLARRLKAEEERLAFMEAWVNNFVTEERRKWYKKMANNQILGGKRCFIFRGTFQFFKAWKMTFGQQLNWEAMMQKKTEKWLHGRSFPL